MYLGVGHASHSKKAEFQHSPISGVLLYLCLHPLTQNDQIRQGNTWGGRVLGVQPRYCVGTNASRCFSAIAEFLVHVPSIFDIGFHP